MKTKTVTEQSGIAEFEVPVDWKMIPAKDDASVQFYPKQRDVVFRASANTYELQGGPDGRTAEDFLSMLSISEGAENGTTRQGNPWRRRIQDDGDARHLHWHVANVQGSRLVLLVFTLSDFLPPGHKRSKAAIATAEHAVDSTRFT